MTTDPSVESVRSQSWEDIKASDADVTTPEYQAAYADAAREHARHADTVRLWEVNRHTVQPGAKGDMQALNLMLGAGWEPFAVTWDGHSFDYHLRRQIDGSLDRSGEVGSAAGTVQSAHPGPPPPSDHSDGGEGDG